ncbi:MULTISPECIES: HvfC/BufC N-terminal domain-containing protein [Paraburkholderia]|uniref:HvfC/BufC N-terminal domain-containing protein n=1 Tax=Paraburkholderia TaxID=1822464 RepID=UPI002256CC94|nr:MULTISPECIES: DNA-binding domain-containing protein [Paraburkholderia]MCX4174073.1 DNA-binding domain-containing protein [Paraburkholderia madseniana]MDQ6462076.1 DNA-binding domain-containing protein [Paraburkholderia madseniana]
MRTSLESLQRMFAESLEGEQRPVLSQLQCTARGVDHAQGRADGPAFVAEQTPCCNGNGNGNGAELKDNLRQRVDLYRSSIRANRRTALASAYPVLLALVGEAYFDALSVAYTQAHPSQSGDLNRFGAALPAFVETYEQAPRFRYFANLARLEWSLHLAYFAADANVLTQAEWAAIRPEDLLETKLAVHPACALISSPYAIAEIWTAHQPGGSFPADPESPTYALVVRPQWRPQILVQSAAAHAAFDALQRGATLNEALDSAFAIDAEFNFTSQWRAWIAASAITGLQPGTQTAQPAP